MADKKFFKVIDGPISIRKDPDGDRLADRLGQGTEIEITVDPVQKNGYTWVQHSKGWSAVQNDGGDEVFMLDISNRDPNAPRLFRVWAQGISIRSDPNGARKPEKLSRGKELSVDPKSRTEAGGYVWWKHAAGWSAECSVNGKEIFMKEVFDVPASTPLDPAKRATLPETWKGKINLQTAQSTKVRNKPTTDSRVMLIVTLKRGKIIQVDMDTVTEADGYYWVRHDLGWSPVMSLDGKTIFLAEPGTIPGLIYIGPDGPKPEELPGYRSLITRLPVSLNDTGWFQYFGNNMWAFLHGKQYGYDRYSQSLHGGLDFGNSARSGVHIYAGIEGEFIKTEYPSPNNTRVLIKSGDYTFIYQHITSVQLLLPGQKVTADTQVASIEHHTINNGWDHLHFEIRYMEDWIINPLLLMTEELYNQVIARFNPEKANLDYGKTPSSLNFFYKSPEYSKWYTPLEQPMIKLNGPCVGPRFDKPEGQQGVYDHE
ncbi:MAG TPA: peptidoglycan DD-metalloendopeptidase family protein [Phototrophicaceae bacterium]|jgi:murein DD-endopeptidase MepM/ murein hydrolase activator NlpD|nr:peptidoglycan DD-metalloendopeptidase family protein [Phototrophicaceae bacterium]